MADTQDPNAMHEFVAGPNGRCAYGAPSPCGRAADAAMHSGWADRTGRPPVGADHPDSLTNAARRTSARRATPAKRRPVPWSRMNGPQRVAVALFGTGAGVVFLSACVAISAVLLRLAGVIG